MVARPWQAGLFVGAVVVFACAVVFFKPSTTNQALLLAPAVAILGLPHGAFDLPLAQHLWPLKGWLGYFRFIAAYLGLASLVLIAWLTLPKLGLSIFLLYSAIHFSADWDDQPRIWRIAGGLSVLGAPTLLATGAVERVFSILSDPSTASILVSCLSVAGWVGASLAVVTCVTRPVLRPMIELSTLWIAAALLPPLVFFVAYFCFLHSPRHMSEVWFDLRDQPGALASAAAVTIMTLIAAAIAYLLLSGPADVAILKTTFIGLAALTVPHMLLLEWKSACSRHRRL